MNLESLQEKLHQRCMGSIVCRVATVLLELPFLPNDFDLLDQRASSSSSLLDTLAAEFDCRVQTVLVEIVPLLESQKRSSTILDRCIGLGQFYEHLLLNRFCFDIKSLSDSNCLCVVLQLNPSTSRKERGAHFTPVELASELVERALTVLMKRQGIEQEEELLSLKVCDPSAGGGVFLILVAEKISTAIITLREKDLNSHQSKESHLAKAHNELHDSEVIAEVIENTIYGLELDLNAAICLKLSLWALAGYSKRVWEALRNHIRVTDSLMFDLLTWQQELGFHQEESCGFDLILGNPPYVSLYGRGSQAHRFSAEYLEHLRGRYGSIDGVSVISGRLNLFLPFIVLSDQLLRPDAEGIAALILPDVIIMNESYCLMRESLTVSGRLLEARLDQRALFVGASVGTASVIWQSAPKKFQHHDVILSEQSDTLHRPLYEAMIKEPYQRIVARPHCSWLPVKTTLLERALLGGEKAAPLGELTLVRDGFNTGSAKRRRELLSRGNQQCSTSRLILEGKSISPYVIDPKALWIKTEAVKDGARFDRPKIIYRQTAPHIIAAVDLEGLCYLNSAHSISLSKQSDQCAFNDKESERITLFALCAYLNSEPFKLRYQLLTGETRVTFPQVHVSSMKAIRVPLALFDLKDAHRNELASLAEQMTETLKSSADERCLTQLKSAINKLALSLERCTLLEEKDPH